MENQDKRNAHEQGSAQHNEEINKEAPKVEIKSQENVLYGLSDKERLQAAESDHKNINGLEDDLNNSATGTLNSGLSEKERTDAAEADGKIGDETKGGLSDKERREAADESW